MIEATMKWDMLGAFVIAVAIPYALSRWPVGASHREVSFAFAVWITMLLLPFAIPGGSVEVAGWGLIFGYLLSWLAIPSIAFFCTRANIPDRLIARIDRTSAR